jgi:hypothetical protein
MIAAELMGFVYWRLLQKIERHQFDVFTHPKIRLNRFEKAGLVARTGFGFYTGFGLPHYGS